MGYKILGFAVWQGGKLYLKRRFSGTALKAAVGGLGLAVVAGVLVAGKQQRNSD